MLIGNRRVCGGADHEGSRSSGLRRRFDLGEFGAGCRFAHEESTACSRRPDGLRLDGVLRRRGVRRRRAQSRAYYPVAGPTGYLPYDPSGVFGGLYGGYNYEFGGGVVVGVEGDVNYGDVQHGTFYHIVPTGSIPNDTGVGDLSWFGSARARLGYAFDKFLPFVTGGAAFADYRNTLVANSNPAFSGSYDHTMVGWTVGGGLDYAVTSNVTLRLEYRYADYGSVSDTLRTNALAVHSTDLKTNDVRIGVGYKF